MTLVRIIKNWDYPSLLRQTPLSSGKWNNINFTCEEVEECDYVIILNGSNNDYYVECPKENIWLIVQEPPTDNVKRWHQIPKYASKLFTSDTSKLGRQYVYSHPALPWHINKTYDDLTNLNVPTKSKELSWITSNKCFYSGHKTRLGFLEKIKNNLDFDLFGKGFTEVEDKWTALSPYKYSLAVENFSNLYYWSEKIADCFLSWTMPIYYGCTNITNYFPEEALIQIDIHSDTVLEEIKSAIAAQKWEKNIEAISYARSLVLNNYQFFPFISSHINSFENNEGKFKKTEKKLILDRFKSKKKQIFSLAKKYIQ